MPERSPDVQEAFDTLTTQREDEMLGLVNELFRQVHDMDEWEGDETGGVIDLMEEELVDMPEAGGLTLSHLYDLASDLVSWAEDQG
jgi:hypothetical protein